MMLLQINECKLTKEEKQFIEQMKQNKTVRQVNRSDLMIEEETQARAEEIQYDCPKDFLEYIKRSFKKSANRNLDTVIDHVYLDTLWDNAIEDLNERIYEGNTV